jgi:hypothetical protein
LKTNLHQLKVKTTTPETPQSKIYNKPGKEEVCVQVLFALVWLVHLWLRLDLVQPERAGQQPPSRYFQAQAAESSRLLPSRTPANLPAINTRQPAIYTAFRTGQEVLLVG